MAPCSLFIGSRYRLLLLVALLTGLLVRPATARQVAPLAAPLDSIGYVQEGWTTDDGLPQNSITAICRTTDGYLWLGTFDGLVRFDGVEFTVFNRSNTPGLGSNRILALAADRAGRLWIGTEGGGLTRMQGGRFTTFTRADGLPADVILSLAGDRFGRMWIGTQGGGLVRYESGRFTAFTTKDGLGSNVVGAVVAGDDGVVWAGAGITLTRVWGDRLTHFVLHGKTDRPIMSLCNAVDGGLWIGTAGDGVFGWPTAHRSSYLAEDGLPTGVIEDLAATPTGRLWVATGAGLARVGADGRLRSYPLRNRPVGKRVLSVYEDVEGSVWIGTDGGGLVRMKPAAVHVYTARDGFRVEPMLAVTESHDGAIWVGTNCGGLTRIGPDGQIVTYGAESGLTNDCIWAVLEDEHGTIWAGSYGQGLFRREPNGHFTRFTDADGLPDNVVLSLSRARGGGFWVGTYNGGFARYRDGRFKKTYTARDGLPSNWVRAVVEDERGIVWIATAGGLSRLDPSGRIRSYTTQEGLGSNDVRALYADSSGAVWIGTYGGGLSRLKDERIVTLARRDGLFDDVVSLIQPDRQGNVWMTSNRGLSRVRHSELLDFFDGRVQRVTAFAYGTADGLPKAECNGGFQPSGWLARDGRLWFPTVEGIGVVDPAQISTNPHPPPVAIQSAQIDDLTLPAGELLTFEAGQRRFELHYTALSLLAASRVRFRYMLEGLDQEWIEAGTRRIAYYTNVPPGRYTFHVLAANNDGVWNERGASLPLVVRAHFYETPLFLALCTLAILGICIVGYRLRVRSIAANEKRLEQLVEKRTADLVSVTDSLLAAETQSRQWTETLYNLTSALSATLDRDEVLDRLLTYLEQAVPFTRAAVGFGRDEVMHEVVAWPGIGGGERREAGLGAVDPATLAELARTRQAIRLPDGADGAVRLAVPLVATHGSATAGVVLLERQPDGVGEEGPKERFSDEEIEVATAFASQAMTAIENARLFGDVQRLATVDGLTEVANRRHFFDLAELECERARRYERPLAVLMLDIDHFKAINDTHGHAVGDQVLRSVAATLRNRLRLTEVVGRYGGEEFAALLPETGLLSAERLAERLRQALAAEPVATDAGPVVVTASFGVAALYSGAEAGAVALLKLADGALYEAKRAGRNRVRVHHDLPTSPLPEPV